MNTEKESLAARVKSLEKQNDESIKYDQYLVIRLDGHKFSKFTKGFKRPFDNIITKSFERVSGAMLEKFGGSLAFTQSDELTIIIPPSYIEKEIKLDQQLSSIDSPRVNRYSHNDSSDYPYHEYTHCRNKETKEVSLVEIEYEADREECSETYYFDDKYNDYLEFQTIYGGQSSRTYGDKEEKIEKIFEKYEIYNIEVKNNQIYAGRIQKITSLMSSYMTLKFNQFLEEEIVIQNASLEEYFGNSFISSNTTMSENSKSFHGQTEEETEFRKQMEVYSTKVGNAWFDCRVYGVDNKEDVFASILFRYRDTIRNSKSAFASAFCSHKSLLNKTTEQQIDFCLESTGEDWSKIDDILKYGIFTKKEKYMKDITSQHPSAMKQKMVERSRFVSFAIDNLHYEEKYVEMMISKYKEI